MKAPKVIIYTLTISICLPLSSYAQEWVRRYNGPGNGNDGAWAIAADHLGNIYVTGSSYDPITYYDYTTIKYSSAGVAEWVRRYNGSDNWEDIAKAIAVDGVGNIYVTGYSHDSITGSDMTTIKYTSAGVQEWVRRYDGSNNQDDYANAIALDGDGNVCVTGYCYDPFTNDDYTTIKYTPVGVEEWVRRYNGPDNNRDLANAIAVDNMDNIYVTGGSYDTTQSYGYATVKYNTAGVEQWVRQHHEIGWDMAKAIAIDTLGNVFVTGCAEFYFPLWVTIRYDTAGTEHWIRTVGDGSSGPCVANALVVDNTGNVYITGSDGYEYYYKQYLTIKYDLDGNVMWAETFYMGWNTYSSSHAITIDDSLNIYVTGSGDNLSNGDYLTLKYDSVGVEQWVAWYNGPINGNDAAYAITTDYIGNICVTGRSSGVAEDFATIKYVSAHGVIEKKVDYINANNDLNKTIFSGPLVLPEDKNCRVFDITGRVVIPEKIKPGIYFIEVDGKITQKVIKIK